MSSHPTDFQGSVIDALREAIEGQIPDSRAEINGGGGHFNIEVTSPVFAGKGMLESQRLVYGAIAHMMKGDRAPVHAVDSLKTRTPEWPIGEPIGRPEELGDSNSLLACIIHE